jgi:hypothetical protein
MHGWELDAAVVDVARQHMGLQELQDSGALVSLHEACTQQRGAAEPN